MKINVIRFFRTFGGTFGGYPKPHPDKPKPIPNNSRFEFVRKGQKLDKFL